MNLKLERFARVACPLAAAALVAGGCGGDDESATTAPPPSTGTGAATLDLPADASGLLKFAKSEVTASPGKLTLRMKNPSLLEHDIAIEGNGAKAKGDVVGQGGTSTFTVDLKPGTYTLYCTVSGHRQGGMKATLTVK